MSKDLWIWEHERAHEDFALGALDEAQFRAELKRLGFDTLEIQEQIDALMDDREGNGIVANMNQLP